MLGRITDHALRRRLTTIPDVEATYELLAASGRRLGALQKVLEERRPGWDPGDSSREIDVLQALVDAGLPSPVQQHQVSVGRRLYLIDLAYPELKIGIEYDGDEAHSGYAAREHDRVRRNRLTAAGWNMLHFARGSTPDEIVETVGSARERGVSHPQLRGFTGQA